MHSGIVPMGVRDDSYFYRRDLGEKQAVWIWEIIYGTIAYTQYVLTKRRADVQHRPAVGVRTGTLKSSHPSVSVLGCPTDGNFMDGRTTRLTFVLFIPSGWQASVHFVLVPL